MLSEHTLFLNFKPVLFAVLLVFAGGVKAEPANLNLQPIKNALNNKEYQKAWQLIKLLNEQWLGEPAFDYLYGVTAMQLEEYHKAVFAFERVVANVPEWQDSRIQLAKAYAAIENYAGVIKQVEILQNQGTLDAKYQPLVQQLKSFAEDALQRQSFSIVQAANLSAGFDSNVNAGTSNERIFVDGLGELILFDESRKSEDEFIGLGYQLMLDKKFSQVSSLRFSSSLNGIHFKDLNQFDRIQAGISTQYHHEFSRFAWQVGLNANPLWLNDKLYRLQGAVFTQVEFSMSKSVNLFAQVSLGKTDNKVNDGLDTDNKSAQLALKYSSSSLRHGLHYHWREEISELSDSSSRALQTLTYRINWLQSAKWLFSGYLGYQTADYQGRHPFFLKTREDEMAMLGISTRYRHTQDVSLMLALNMQDKTSSIELFEYDRAELKFTVNYAF
ncbi:DUF2860 family protein [Catenovulum sediminis]|uniref:Surface lipoprotein assembly modifier n=1 Tax=Catenovulum sediminis TaxID=1740262 RepID=A0ABV1REL4_9ALTE|nr:surface lipoprotein assembly modifier [Catenovulum sediminis]